MSQTAARRHGVVEAAVMFVGCVIVIIRYPRHDSFWRNLWAEDGFQFLRCRVNTGTSCLGRSYQGYQQLIPRLYTELVPLVPVADWAIVMALGAVVLDAVCLTLVHRATAWLIPSVWVRAALTLTIGASAAAHWEVAGNFANLHWFLLLSAIFIAADRDANDSPRWLTCRTLWLVAVCFSEGLAPVIAVAYVVGLVLRRHRRGGWQRADLVGGAVTVLSALAQFINSLIWPREPVPRPAQTLGDVARYYRQWVLDWGWAGPTRRGHDFTRVFEAGVAVLLVVGVALLLIKRDWRSLQWVSVAAGVLLGIGSILNLGLSVIENESIVPRYIFMPFALVVIGIVIVVYRLYERFRWTPIAAGVLVTAILATVLVMGPYPPLVSKDGPSWRVQVAAAKQACKTLSPGTRQVMVISPKNFTLSLTCRRIDS